MYDDDMIIKDGTAYKVSLAQFNDCANKIYIHLDHDKNRISFCSCCC